MVRGEVTSCLHLNIPVGSSTGFHKCVSQFVVASYYISTTLAGECTMAKRIKYRGEQFEPPELSRPSYHLMATGNSEDLR